MITVKEFAKQRNIDPDTVTAWIRRHPEVDKDLIRHGKNILIPPYSTALEALEKKYPLPQPIQIIEDTESQKQLIKSQQENIELHKQIEDLLKEANKNAKALAQIEANEQKLLIAQQNLNEVQTKNEELQQDLNQSKKETEDTQQKLDDKQKEVSSFRHLFGNVFIKK
jgi:DNA repair exonuclease SbcCD ATPase subunit